MTGSRKRILLLRASGALGDVVLTLPVVSALRTSFPHAHLEIAGNVSLLELARGEADAVVSEPEGIWNIYADDAPLKEELRQYLGAFDLIVAFDTPGGPAARRLADAAGEGEVVVVDPVPRDGAHAADWFLRPLKELGIRGSCLPRVEVSPVDRDVAATLLAHHGLDAFPGILCFAPGSGSASKNWPRRNFEQVMETLSREADSAVIELLGPAEAGEGPQNTASPRPGRMVAKNLSVPLLAAVLCRCDAFIGNDSGVTHLAAAVGTPTVAVFGPTDASVWGPRGANAAVVTSAVECAPCGNEKRRSCENRRCLESIDVEQVTAPARTMMRLSRGRQPAA